MSRFFKDEAGRVVERATGLELGSVFTARFGGEAIHLPVGLDGSPLRGPTLILDLAMLAVVRAERPDDDVSLRDLHG